VVVGKPAPSWTRDYSKVEEPVAAAYSCCKNQVKGNNFLNARFKNIL
jgi:hypothetical protein